MVTQSARDDMPPRRPLKRSEYELLVAQGVFEGERVELIHGELVAMSPQGAPRRYYGAWLLNRLSALLGGRARIQAHSPVRAADESEPEPDVCGEYRRIATAVPGSGARLVLPPFPDVAIDVDELFADPEPTPR